MGRYTLVAGIGGNHLPNDNIYATVIKEFLIPRTRIWCPGTHFQDFVNCVVDSEDDWTFNGLRIERDQLPRYDDVIKLADIVFYPEFQPPDNFEKLDYDDFCNREIRFPLTENRKLYYGKRWCFIGIIITSILYLKGEAMTLRPEEIFSAEEIYQKLVESGRLPPELTFQVVENCCG